MEPTFFLGKSAWFSCSVDETIKYLWEKHGGTCASKDIANFLFSEDVDAEDTKCLYRGNAYLREHLAVFHAQYISQTIEAADPASVVLGDYYLPPPEVIKELRERHKPNVIQEKKYISLPNARARKRKCSGDVVSVSKAKENVTPTNDRHSSEQPNTGEGNPMKEAKRLLKNTQVSSQDLGTHYSKQQREGNGGAMFARKQNYADSATQTPQKNIVSDAQYQQPLINTNDSEHYAKEWRTKNPPPCCQLASTPTRSQGIQTVEDLHSLDMQDTLIVERAGSLSTRREMSVGSLMEYSSSRPCLQHNRISDRGWDELSHQSHERYRMDMDQGSSGTLVPNPRENFSPRQEPDNFQEAAGYMDALNYTDKGETEVTPKQSSYCVML